MNIQIILSEPYTGMISGWPTRYIGIIKELYKRYHLSIFAPGDTTLLRNSFPDAHVCMSTSLKVIQNKFSLFKYFHSFLFPRRDNIFLPEFAYYPDFYELLLSSCHQNYDIIFYFGIKSINYYPHFDNVPIICDLCDSGLRHILSYLNNKISFKKKAVTYLDIVYLYRIKKKIISPDVTILAATKKDSFYIKKTLRKNKIYTVSNGIDDNKIIFNDEYCINKWKSNTIIFCGSLDYEPNIRTIYYILQELWTTLKELAPNVKLEIVGRNLSSRLSDFISQYKDVFVYNNVPDVFTFYKSSKLILSPLFSGGGIKNKFLEALSTATPIVTNSEGAIGIKLQSEMHGYITEGKDSLISATKKILMADFHRYRLWCENCFVLSKKYSWSHIGDNLSYIIEKTVRK